MQFKSFMEALKGKQHKIDKNKNNKIDAQDFEILRKEETEGISEATVDHKAKYEEHMGKHYEAAEEGDFDEMEKHAKKAESHATKHFKATGKKIIDPGYTGKHPHITSGSVKESEERMARADYRVGPSGRKSHKEIVFNSGEEDEKEKKDKIEEKAPPGFEGTVKAMKKHKEIDNPYALAWYMKNKGMKSHKKASGAMKEEAEQIEEKSDQAKQNKTMKNMMDASRGARYKLNNPVPDAEPQHKTAQAHNKAIGRALRNEEKKEDPPFDGPYTKTPGTTKDKSGAVHTPMSRAKHLARMAMKQKMKEEFDIDMSDDQADSILDYINEQAPVAPVPGQKWKDHAVMVNGKQRVVVKRSNAKNYPEQEGWKEVAPGQKLKEEDDVKFSYTELMMINEIKLADLPVRKIKGHSYGANYSDPEGADDMWDKESLKKPTAEKRGRGRPAGSQSGARKNYGSSKLHTK